jgi:hypothetical protein
MKLIAVISHDNYYSQFYHPSSFFTPSTDQAFLPYSELKSNWEYTHQNALATWTEVKTLQKQQNFYIQSNTQTNLDLWNTTVGYGFHFKLEILERFQSKVLCMTVNAPWYMPNI